MKEIISGFKNLCTHQALIAATLLSRRYDIIKQKEGIILNFKKLRSKQYVINIGTTCIGTVGQEITLILVRNQNNNFLNELQAYRPYAMLSVL